MHVNKPLAGAVRDRKGVALKTKSSIGPEGIMALAASAVQATVYDYDFETHDGGHEGTAAFPRRVIAMTDLIESNTLRTERQKSPFGEQFHGFDLGISMTTIVYERHSEPLNFIGRRRPSEDFAIERRVQREGRIRDAEDEPSILAYITGHDDSKFSNIQCRDAAGAPCYISMESVDVNWWSSRIFIPDGLFRRLVELHSTKRIDNIQLSIRLNMSQGNLRTPAFPSLKAPLFGSQSLPYFPHVPCQLLSVYTSLAKPSVGDTAAGGRVLLQNR
jgi:hypothetical protein